jgi:ABC-type hemin transport system ATPase subunit
MMYQGKIIADGTPEQVLNAENLKTVFGLKLPKGGFKALELAP